MKNTIFGCLQGAKILNDRVAVVTGSAAGIGRACAHLFARQGAKLVLVDINTEGINSVCNDIKSFGGHAITVDADITNEKDIAKVYQVTLENYGRLNCLINNAGGGLSTDFFDISIEEWNRVIALNLNSMFLMSQKAAVIFKEQRSGTMVNLSSIAGRSTSVTAGCHYTSAKAGILGLTRHMARQLAPYNVRVNAVCPGVTNSERLVKRMEEKGTRKNVEQSSPLGRIGDVYEIACSCLFMASDMSSYITGATLDVNGGALMI